MHLKRFCFFVVLGLLGFALISCTDTSSDKPVQRMDSIQLDTLKSTENKDTIAISKPKSNEFNLSDTDISILAKMDSFELGMSFNQIKKIYPVLKGIRPEEKKDKLAVQGLTESVGKQPLFGGLAQVEFNFQHDSTYSYFFTFTGNDFKKSEEIFNALMVYFVDKWGDPRQEGIEEENHYNQSYIWPSKKGSNYFINYNLNTGIIVFGKRAGQLL